MSSSATIHDLRYKGAIRGLILFLFPVIWLLDTAWWILAPEVLVVCIMVPFTWWFCRQYPSQQKQHTSVLYPVLFMLLGALFNITTLCAFSWAWMAVYFLFPGTTISTSRMVLLCSGAFPWVLLDFQRMGWLFRLSGAAVTGDVYNLLGYDVRVEGTQLEVNGLPVFVEAACGGMQLLQVLISCGLGLNILSFPRSRAFWVMIPLLPLLAWLSNTTRIIVITAWGLTFGTESASGIFHTWGAMLVLVIMLLFYTSAVKLLQKIT